MRKTNRARAVVRAKEKGYRVEPDGRVIGVRGEEIRTHLHGGACLYRSFCVAGENGGTPSQVKVAVLQAYQKFGPKALDDGVEVRHLNNNPTDDSWNNIDIGTSTDNHMDMPKEKRVEKAKRAASARRKLTVDQVVNLRRRKKDGKSLASLAREYGLSKSTVSYIVNNKTYK